MNSRYKKQLRRLREKEEFSFSELSVWVCCLFHPVEIVFSNRILFDFGSIQYLDLPHSVYRDQFRDVISLSAARAFFKPAISLAFYE